jgi:hypothetical protein
MCYKIVSDMNDVCYCELFPEHKVGEHDWCCQTCGGRHVERLCPERVEHDDSGRDE